MSSIVVLLGSPVLLIRYFNVILNLAEKRDIHEYKGFIIDNRLIDLECSGMPFIWSNDRQGEPDLGSVSDSALATSG